MVLAAALAPCALAGDQRVPGAGNEDAAVLARKSPMVQSAYAFLLSQAKTLKDAKLRAETLDALGNPQTCVHHRANLNAAKKEAILTTLVSQGLLNPEDGAGIGGAAMAGVFPPLRNDGGACPQLPQPVLAAPGGVSLTGHHSYPGGLPIHEANNEVADLHLAEEYRAVYGHSSSSPAAGGAQLPALDDDLIHVVQPSSSAPSDIFIDQDLIVGAPLWHDWAKAMVFQWNADGSEFGELNFGGAGVNDDYGAAGDSRTGAHHILGLAEEMSRGLSPAFVITVQLARTVAPTGGNEYKVVNWLRAAAIVAQIDPVAKGYLAKDASGNLRLPALRKLGAGVDLNAAGQPNVLVEYTLHNLSDGDATFSTASVDAANVPEDCAAAIWDRGGRSWLPEGISQPRAEFSDGGAADDSVFQRGERRGGGGSAEELFAKGARVLTFLFCRLRQNPRSFAPFKTGHERTGHPQGPKPQVARFLFGNVAAGLVATT